MRRGGEAAVPMTVERSRTRDVLLALVLAASGGASVAADPAAPGEMVERVLSGIVELRATAPENARTAPFLGTERRGSGVVIDATGLIVTIGYLILEADAVEIVVAESPVPAEVVAYDYTTGLGLVRATGPLGVAPLKLGDSDALSESDGVIVAAFGGLAGAQPGLIVSRRDFAGYWEYILEGAIFTAPPHPGFAGAALLGGRGELLGIGYLVVGDAIEGRPLPGNMFVPVNRLKPILGELLTDGRSAGPPRPWLGLFAQAYESRVFVVRVASDGPAEAAGIASGDLILGVGDTPVRSLFEFYRAVWALGTPGVEVPLVVLNETGIAQRRVRSGDRYDWLISHPGRR